MYIYVCVHQLDDQPEAECVYICIYVCVPQLDDQPEAAQVWTLMDPSKAGNISRQAIQEMDDTVLSQVSMALNTPHVKAHDEL